MSRVLIFCELGMNFYRRSIPPGYSQAASPERRTIFKSADAAGKSQTPTRTEVMTMINRMLG